MTADDPLADITFRCEPTLMMRLVPLALLMVSGAPADHPHSYLLSIRRIPLRDRERIQEFSIQTWDVEFKAVCRIPAGWRIKAGGSATPNGELNGIGSQGATWFYHGSPKELQSFVLVTLYGPVQRAAIGTPDNGVPATFRGTATISTDNGEVKRALNYRNITLTSASRCPSR